MNEPTPMLYEPRDGAKLAIIGIVLKLIPWVVFTFESVRHPNFWESFSWLPEKFASAFAASAILMILGGYVLGFMCVERYILAYYHFKKAKSLEPRFSSLVLGCTCLLTEPLCLLLINLTDGLRRHA